MLSTMPSVRWRIQVLMLNKSTKYRDAGGNCGRVQRDVRGGKRLTGPEDDTTHQKCREHLAPEFVEWQTVMFKSSGTALVGAVARSIETRRHQRHVLRTIRCEPSLLLPNGLPRPEAEGYETHRYSVTNGPQRTLLDQLRGN